ncbi:MAG: hypothetical protein EBW93_06925 [Betaproteobacteria bacterium]|nr:hypothetical protein [Betaproteobacteria bacterium]
MNLEQTKWELFESQVSLDKAATERVFAMAEASIKARGQFHLVLAGGSTPKNVYTLLKDISSDWHKWQIYFQHILNPKTVFLEDLDQVFLEFVPSLLFQVLQSFFYCCNYHINQIHI